VERLVPGFAKVFWTSRRLAARWSVAGILIALAVAAAQPPHISQTEPPKLIPRTRERREQEYHDQHRAILNVKVTDSSGKTVTGLQREDFTLLDNGQARPIEAVREVEHGSPLAPPRLVFLLDAVNNSSRSVLEDRKRIESFLALEKGELSVPTSIALLTDDGVKVDPASQNRAVLLWQVEELTRGVHNSDCNIPAQSLRRLSEGAIQPGSGSFNRVPEGSTNCENHRFIRSLTQLESLAMKEENTPGRLILIWMGRGWPLLEGQQFRPDSPQMRQNFFEHLVLLSTALREGQVTLDAVIVPRHAEPGNEHDTAFLDGVPDENQMSAGSLSLRAMAHQSGGQFLDRSEHVVEDFAQCMSDLEFYYALSFDFPPSAAPNEFHRIEVRVNRPGVTVRTNTVYYAQP
jgi:VWFA-related protein